MNINLSKSEAKDITTLVLSKKGFSSDIKAKVNVVLDGSGSMADLYDNGTVSTLVNRILTIGQFFDDDGSIDIFDFSHGDNFRQLEPSTQEDYDRTFKILGGGTSYSPVLREVERFYYSTEGMSSGFLGMFKKKVTDIVPEGREDANDKQPVFTVFITDGASGEAKKDLKEINDILANHPDMFIMFVGIGKEKFKMLESITENNSNAGFYDAGDLSQTDQELFEGILSPKTASILGNK